MGLEGQAHLEDAVAQQDQAHGADEGKNEVGQILHDGWSLFSNRQNHETFFLKITQVKERTP